MGGLEAVERVRQLQAVIGREARGAALPVKPEHFSTDTRAPALQLRESQPGTHRVLDQRKSGQIQLPQNPQ